MIPAPSNRQGTWQLEQHRHPSRARGEREFAAPAQQAEFFDRVTSGPQTGNIVRLVLGAGVLLPAVSVLAVLLPALRAARLDPAAVLRDE